MSHPAPPPPPKKLTCGVRTHNYRLRTSVLPTTRRESGYAARKASALCSETGRCHDATGPGMAISVTWKEAEKEKKVLESFGGMSMGVGMGVGR